MLNEFEEKPLGLQKDSQEGAQPVTPSGERPPEELFERAREAVAALRGHGRQSDGRAGPGNAMAVKTGLRSSLLLEQRDVAEWHREQVEAIHADLGGASELSSLQRASVREVARLEIILAALGDELIEGGVLTGKGAMRAATTTYLMVLDRFIKIAGVVGLQRQTKRVPSLAEVMNDK